MAYEIDMEQEAADRVYWQQLADELSWTLSGWSGQHSGSFHTPGHGYIQLTGEQRDAIMSAVARAREAIMNSVQTRSRATARYAQALDRIWMSRDASAAELRHMAERALMEQADIEGRLD